MPAVDNIRLPFAEAIAALRERLGNLVPTETWRDLMGNAHDRAFVVAGAQKAELLADFGNAVEQAVAEGRSIQWFREQFDDIVAEHGWEFRGPRDWRTRVIYKTNMTTSYAAGRLKQLRSPELRQLKPWWLYQHNDSVTHPRPLHVSWDGLVLSPDDPWWQTHYPPSDWGCQCYVVAVSERDAERFGGRFEAAPDDGIDPSTGLPAGIGEGWDHQPGETSQLVQDVTRSAGGLPDAIERDLLRDIRNIPPADDSIPGGS